MFPHLGIEALNGVGGGMESPESTRNLRIANDWVARGHGPNALRYLKKAMEDPRNLDADIQYAFNFTSSKEEGLIWLEGAEQRGRAILKEIYGNDCFAEGPNYVGDHWHDNQAGPFMRVFQTLVRLAFQVGQKEKAANYGIEMMLLCNHDKLNMCPWIPALLLNVPRPADALSFIQNWTTPAALAGERVEHGGIDFHPPSQVPLSALAVQEISGKAPDMAMLYDGALAYFTLWGDCQPARQFLGMAIQRNAWVMIRILDRVRQPTDMDKDQMRDVGGVDRASANDYLFLAQHLWMAPKVWKWIDKAEIKNQLLRPCELEFCRNVEAKPNAYKRCKGCHEVRYCSVGCQKVDWRAHKPACKEAQRRAGYEKKLAQPPLLA